jgi:riboflavin kinase/FMN adenylyltransferase
MAIRVVRSLAKWKKRKPGLVLCVGNFDGVHRGHRKIFDRVVREARRLGATPAVLTFHPHPGKVLRPAKAPLPLVTLEQKIRLLEDVGMEVALVLPFTRALSRLSAEAFVEKVLVKRLTVEMVFVGSNFRFGRGQSGNPDVLRELARKQGFRIGVVAPVKSGGSTISSTRIRRLVTAGDMGAAARLLGRPFALTGGQKRGAGRGRGLGFSTVNFVPEQACLPARGVYVTETRIGSRYFPSVTNVGVRPTFRGRKLLVESHLLRFPRKARVRTVEVHFWKRLRDEQKFPSAEALQKQIARDVAQARRFLARRKD